jgi:SAM-dependent methyltransferase
MDAKLDNNKLYTLDPHTRALLIESAPLMDKWATPTCKPKDVGGMEEWAKNNKDAVQHEPNSCGWYHSTWQYLRLLDMVAVPPWYPFYDEAISSILKAKPDAHVFISACADWGMLARLHDGIKLAGTKPRITIYDICETPLKSAQWYADRFGLEIETHRDNLITSPKLPLGEFDLIVTDEFLTVLKDDYKPEITKRWFDLLKPGGSIVTTAMVGGPTTPELRRGYAERARRLMDSDEGAALRETGTDPQDLAKKFDFFAAVHTRHMLTGEEQVRSLFSAFELKHLSFIPTPGECVNPTSSFQIVATRPKG